MMSAILLLVGNLTLTAGDTILYNRLVADGHTVTTRLDSDANKDVTGIDAVVASRTITTKPAGYATAACGVMFCSWFSWDTGDLDFTSSAALSANPMLQQVRIDDHPISTAAGFAVDSVIDPAWTTDTGGRYARIEHLGLDAQVFARFGVGSDSLAVLGFTYESGATMQDSHVAEGRRVGFTIPDAGADLMSATTLDLWSAAVAWVADVATVPVVVNTEVTRTVTIDATGSTGAAPLAYAFTQASGPTVTITDHGDGTASFDLPDPHETDIVIAVTVTGDDSEQATSNVTIPASGGGGGDGGYRMLIYDASTDTWG